MFFRRKLKNRRFERGHILDVKLRTKEVRAARYRLAGRAAAISLGTLLGVYLVWRAGEWALDEFIFQNDAFAIRKLEIQTDGNLSSERIRTLSGVKIGDNLLGLDLSRVRQELQLSPLIRSASVERVLPHTLRVQVEERVPVAFARKPEFGAGGTGLQMARYGLDPDAFVLRGADAGLQVPLPGQGEALPEITGFDATELSPGRVLAHEKVRSALLAIREFERSPMAGLVDLRLVDLSGTGSMVLETTQGSRVTFGLGRLEEQFRRWRLVHDYATGLSQAIQTLDLSVTNNAPVLLVDARTAPTPPVKSKPPSRPRKRNV